MLLSSAITFKLALTTQENLKGLISSQSITDSFWTFIFIPLIVNITSIFLIGLFYEIEYDVLYKLIIGDKDFKFGNAQFHKYVMEFLGFTIFSLFIGYVFGWIIVLIERKWSVITRFIGLNNEWYSLFDGQTLTDNSELSLTLINILSNTQETTTIYSGILVEYFLKPRSNGELEYIVLSSATRIDMKKSQHAMDMETRTNPFSPDNKAVSKIPGEFFIIPMKEVLNINVSFLKLEEVQAVKKEEAPSGSLN